MECSDQLNIKLAEWVIASLRPLREPNAISAISVQAFWCRRRFELTVRRRGPRDHTIYTWSVVEVDAEGNPLEQGLMADSASRTFNSPEDAYWDASETVQVAISQP
ncbi:hypothetical protein [Thermobaculum terrenum]|uniref:hypothetical protein n=1 Tax=Thermobaculum terrenum TaxID=166501 RepID=UPI000319889F|nr:hypothetical protein [Thermobaculum terrenum]